MWAIIFCCVIGYNILEWWDDDKRWEAAKKRDEKKD
jgi:hypothetical protein